MKIFYRLLILLYFLNHNLFQPVITQDQTLSSDISLGNIIAERYTLRIVPCLNNLTFWGHVSIEITVLNSTNEILIEANGLCFEEVILWSIENDSMLLNKQDKSGDWLLTSETDLTGQFTVDISFSGCLNDENSEGGLYYNRYISNETDVYYITSHQSRDRCAFFPCLQEPKMTQAPVKLFLARFLNQSSQSNMPLESSTEPDDSIEGQVWDVFSQSPYISPLQVGFIIHEVTRVTNLTYTILTVPYLAPQASLAVSVLPTAMKAVQQWLLNLPFPLSKLDVMALPHFHHEMDHFPGLVNCREDKILFKEGVSSEKSRIEVIRSMVNILIHQWLGVELILEDWLVQGVTDYLEQAVVSEMEPSWRAKDLFYVETVQTAFLEGVKGKIHSRISALLWMTENIFSYDVMKKGLKIFAENRGVTSLSHLIAAINQSAVDEGLSAVLPDSWTVTDILHVWSCQPGYPIVTVQLQTDLNETVMKVSQKNVLQRNTDSDNELPVKLSFLSESEYMLHKPIHRAWLLPGQTEMMLRVPLPLNYPRQEWVLFNIDQSGFYRINYDSENWQLLTNQLVKNHTRLSAVTRSQLVDDVFQLACSEQLDYSVVFSITQYLKEEKDLIPWISATRNFEQLINLFYGTELASELQEYARDLFSPFFQSVVRHFSGVNDAPLLARLDALSWACHWRLQSCLDLTRMLFKQWQSSSLGFPPQYKPAMLCFGVRQFPESFLEVLDAFTLSVVEADRQVFLEALACTEDPWSLQFLLETAFRDNNQNIFSQRDRMKLFKEIVKNPENVNAMVRFLVTNYYEIISRVGEQFLNSADESLGKGLILKNDVELLNDLLQNSSLNIKLRNVFISSLATALSIQLEAARLAPLVSRSFLPISSDQNGECLPTSSVNFTPKTTETVAAVSSSSSNTLLILKQNAAKLIIVCIVSTHFCLVQH